MSNDQVPTPTVFALGDYAISLIRTYVPVAAGSVVSWLALRGVEVTDDLRLMMVTVLTGLAIAGYYTIARTLEAKWPILGRILLGSKSTPSYSRALPPADPTPDQSINDGA